MRIKGVPAEGAPETVQRLFNANAQRLGRVAIPLTAFAHCPSIMQGYEELGSGFRKAKLVESRLKTLACIRAAQMVGCPFWVDINSAVGRNEGLSDEQLAELTQFEASSHFDALEKAVLRYTEGMSRTPADISDEVFDDLARHFNTEQIVELTAMIAFENLRARFNRALHIESDGFCELPPDHPVRKAVRPFK